MLPCWAGEYIGIPYKFGGDSLDGCDCYGLVKMILKDQFNKILPDFTHKNADQRALSFLVDEALPLLNVTKTNKPDIGSIVIIKLLGYTCHIGLCLDSVTMIHTLHNHNSIIARHDSRQWRKKIEGFYNVN
jgi:cell wall-associated NlpC family hydrolase